MDETVFVLSGTTEPEKILYRGSIYYDCSIVRFAILFICIDHAGVPIEHGMRPKLSFLRNRKVQGECDIFEQHTANNTS